MQFEMAYWYGLIDDQLYMNVNQNCNLSYWDFDAGLLSPSCKNWMNVYFSLINGINHYDFLGKCYIDNDYTPFISALETETDMKQLQFIPNCVYALPVYYYLNNRTVMNALHVPANVTGWDYCKDKGDFSYTKNRSGSIDIYSELISSYKILVYSGDTDGSVPTYGTKRWIDSLGWPVDADRKYKQFFVDG
jgi:hypothetical protein